MWVIFIILIYCFLLYFVISEILKNWENELKRILNKLRKK